MVRGPNFSSVSCRTDLKLDSFHFVITMLPCILPSLCLRRRKARGLYSSCAEVLQHHRKITRTCVIYPPMPSWANGSGKIPGPRLRSFSHKLAGPSSVGQGVAVPFHPSPNGFLHLGLPYRRTSTLVSSTSGTAPQSNLHVPLSQPTARRRLHLPSDFRPCIGDKCRWPREDEGSYLFSGSHCSWATFVKPTFEVARRVSRHQARRSTGQTGDGGPMSLHSAVGPSTCSVELRSSFAPLPSLTTRASLKGWTELLGGEDSVGVKLRSAPIFGSWL